MIDETWEQFGSHLYIDNEQIAHFRRISGVEEAESASDYRSQLAAQAPAMARLLLQWQAGTELSGITVQEVLRAAGVLP